MKRWISMFLVVALFIALTPATLAAGSEIVDSGYCGGEGDGTNLTWTLTADGTLTIRGEGEMKEYWTSPSPWQGEDVVRAIIDSGVTTIGDATFFNCANLVEVVIPDSVNSIGIWAFGDCDSLEEVMIPNGVTSIGRGAFFSCDSLVKVVVPDGVNLIEDFVFGECVSLEEVVIPDSVSSIGKTAFSHCRSLKEVVIPDSVRLIGDSAFSYCNSLVEMVIPGSVELMEDFAFSYCESLVSLTIKEGVQTIGNYAFRGCISLKELILGEGIHTIGYSAFYYCPSLEKVVIPGSVNSIESYAFYNCDGLKGLALNEGVCAIGDYAFYSCGSLAEVAIPDSMNSIGGYAFADCGNLTDLELGEGVHMIGVGAFERCASLTEVVIPDSVNSIGEWAFNGCDSLRDLTLGESVCTIGDYAFYSCSNLAEVAIPDSVHSIGAYAFYGCERLKDLTLGEGICTIDSATFYNCSNLAEVVIPRSVSSIGHSAFENCCSLAEVVIPGSVKSIGERAFKGCESLVSLTMEEGIQTIGYSSFMDCPGLEEIVIPGGVNSIGCHAFHDGNLSRVYFLGNAPVVFDISYRWPSFDSDATLHYIPGTSGWTESEHYDAAAGTWNGYKLEVWAPDYLCIQPIQPDGIALNGGGYPYPHFVVTDYSGTPLSGVMIRYSVDGGDRQSAVSDGNGMFRAILPHTGTTTDYDVEFSVPGHSGDVWGAKQTVTAKVKALSYSQKWTGALGAEIEAGIGAGAGAQAGSVSAQADLIRASASGKISGGFSLEDSYEDDGRTLEVAYSYDTSVGAKIDAGMNATLPFAEINLVSADAGVGVSFQDSLGLKIEDYSPDNMDQALDLGAFLLQVALIGVKSVTVQKFLHALDVGIHNQAAISANIAADAGASIGAVEVSDGERNEFEFLGGKAAAVVTATSSADYLKGTTGHKFAAAREYGFGVLEGFEELGTKGILHGFSGNGVEVEAQFNAAHALDSISFQLKESSSGSLMWVDGTNEVSQCFTFDDSEVARITEENRLMDLFARRKITLLAPIALTSSLAAIDSGTYQGSLVEKVSSTHGVEFSFPVELNLGISVKGALEGSFAEEITYSPRSGIYKNGQKYITAVSDVSSDRVAARRKTLDEIIWDAFDAVLGSLAVRILCITADVSHGVVNGSAQLNGHEQWCAEISVIDNENEYGENGSRAANRSYAILTLNSSSQPDGSAAVAVTLGEPYTVSIYTDESKQTLVSDAELAASSLTLALAYDSDMLSAAGVDADADIRIFRFDSESNVYIPVSGCVQNKLAMTVTAPVVAQGEYILATDNASPLVSNFVLSDRTADPTLTALVSDLSGIGEFAFWLDDGTVLVDTGHFEDHYDQSANLFSYTFEGLTSGEHTVYIQATDTLGNANAQPFRFTFTVDGQAPVISQVTIPTDTVTNPAGFTVAASVSDNEQLSQVLLDVTCDGGETTSVTMRESDGVWKANVTGLEGVSVVNVAVVAFDLAGNRSESESFTVQVNVPDTPAPIILTAEWIAEGESIGAAVTVKTDLQQSVGGWLICAAYGEDGRMLTMSSTYIGLRSADEQTFALTMDSSGEEICCGRVYFIDVNGGWYVPFCESFQLSR